MAGELPEAAERGRRVYFDGTGSDPIRTVVGRGDVEVPSTTVPCAGCHGEDGRGRREGAIVPPDITWQRLLQPSGHQHDNGRGHPPFTEESIALAVRVGRDPAGQALDPAMPRYRLSDRDMGDLLAYLHFLGSDFDAGLSEGAVTLGTLLPQGGHGDAVAGLLAAYLSAINREGGVYGRELRLRVERYGESEATPAARRLTGRDGVFAIVAPAIPARDAAIAALWAAEGIPVIGPLTPAPAVETASTAPTFYLAVGVADKLRALVDFAAKNRGLQDPKVAVVWSGEDRHAEWVAAVASQGSKHGWQVFHSMRYLGTADEAPRLVASLQPLHPDAVFYLATPTGLSRLMAAARGAGFDPPWFAPAVAVGRDVLEHRTPAAALFIAYPVLGTDLTRESMIVLAALHDKHAIPAAPQPVQAATYGAARLTVEALRRTGQALSRRKLVAALEGLREFRTGASPPLTFGANRRIGALGAYVVHIDPSRPEWMGEAVWMGLE